MFRDLILSPSRKRLLLLLVGIVGLAVCATVFYTSQMAQQQTATTTRTAANVPVQSANDNGKMEHGNTVLTIADTPVSTEQLQGQRPTSDSCNLISDTNSTEGSKSTKRKLQSTARNKLASRLPYGAAPAGNPYGRSSLPRHQVEMWSGGQETIVSVPQGHKVEE